MLVEHHDEVVWLDRGEDAFGFGRHQLRGRLTRARLRADFLQLHLEAAGKAREVAFGRLIGPVGDVLTDRDDADPHQ